MLPAAASVWSVPASPGDPVGEPVVGSAVAVHASSDTDAVEGVVTEERRAWDRRDDETTRKHAAFRAYRDLGPLRTLEESSRVAGIHVNTAQKWAAAHDWSARVTAWDDECHMLDDRRRLESIRTMHDQHQRAARAAMAKGIAALSQLQPEQIPAYAAARLLELGIRIERETLTTSVEELQGMARRMGDAPEDPWEAIARDLQGTPG